MKNFLGLFAVCSLLSCVAISQDYPRAEVFGGYSYLNIDTNGLSARQSANGWEGSVSGNFSKWFAAEADVSGYYKTYSVNLASLIPGNAGVLSVTVNDYAYLAGPRVNVRPVFFHALFGGDHLTGNALGFSRSQDSLAGGVGGGVQWKVSTHVSVCSSADYVFSRHNILGGPSVTQNNFRVGADRSPWS